MLLELIERLLTNFVAAAQKVIPMLKIERDPQHDYISVFQKGILLVLMWMPMRHFSGFSTVCNHLFRPGFAYSNPRTYRWPCKPQSKLVRL